MRPPASSSGSTARLSRLRHERGRAGGCTALRQALQQWAATWSSTPTQWLRWPHQAAQCCPGGRHLWVAAAAGRAQLPARPRPQPLQPRKHQCSQRPAARCLRLMRPRAGAAAATTRAGGPPSCGRQRGCASACGARGWRCWWRTWAWTSGWWRGSGSAASGQKPVRASRSSPSPRQRWLSPSLPPSSCARSRRCARWSRWARSCWPPPPSSGPCWPRGTW
mmetsp:Transcript_17712/g.44627  ORF Transcript_17712/g.44627 Transcript_17712/m.44627 type:complete len:221 (+) Transcript_17712:367-1029(+)